MPAGAHKECFVVSVIGEEGSPQRLHADWVLEGIIKPTFDEHFKDHKVVRADQMNTPGLIDAQIIDKLLNADLVIADLTFLNPNAFYEIGIRHVVARPIIHMNLATERIPFDISLYLSLKFSVAHPNDLVKARAGLKGMVENVLADGYEVENPVTKARGRVKFEETATSVDKILQTEVANVAERLASMEEFIGINMRSRHETSYRTYQGDPAYSAGSAEWRKSSRDSENVHFIAFEAVDTSPDVLRAFINESMEKGLLGNVVGLHHLENMVEVSLSRQPTFEELNRVGKAAKQRGISIRQL